MAVIERFVFLLYEQTSAIVEVNQARKDLFTKKARNLENIPPTRTALEQHTMRAVFQGANIWGQVLLTQPVIPSPSAWGWEKDGTSWKPKWTTLPQAKDTCYELIHCGCKKGCRGRCKCLKANLDCTGLCNCGGNCNLENISSASGFKSRHSNVIAMQAVFQNVSFRPKSSASVYCNIPNLFRHICKFQR